MCKAAGMAHDGYARAIRPVHTSMDGDSIYAVSLGDVPADLDAVGVIGARVDSISARVPCRCRRSASKQHCARPKIEV